MLTHSMSYTGSTKKDNTPSRHSKKRAGKETDAEHGELILTVPAFWIGNIISGTWINLYSHWNWSI